MIEVSVHSGDDHVIDQPEGATLCAAAYAAAYASRSVAVSLSNRKSWQRVNLLNPQSHAIGAAESAIVNLQTDTRDQLQ